MSGVNIVLRGSVTLHCIGASRAPRLARAFISFKGEVLGHVFVFFLLNQDSH